MRVEATRFKLKKDKIQRADEWMKVLNVRKNVRKKECLQTLIGRRCPHDQRNFVLNQKHYTK